MSLAPSIRAVVFDAYGTLFDVYAVGATAERFFPGQGQALALLWRDKQIEYTRLRTMSARYLPFWQVTQDALSYSLKRLKLELEPAQRDELLGQYLRLDAYPECAAVLAVLRERGLRLAILSNGNPEMLASAVAAARFEPHFEHLLSVDAVRRFKTAPEAYQLAPDAFGCTAPEILFVSSNGWDVAGAAWFGFTTFWVNRGGLPMEELGVQPNGQGRTLEALLSWRVDA
jgi:2-haloacid dehalogenase